MMHDIAGNKLKVGDMVLYLVNKEQGNMKTGPIEDIYQVKVGKYSTYVAEIEGNAVTAAGIGLLTDRRVQENFTQYLANR